MQYLGTINKLGSIMKNKKINYGEYSIFIGENFSVNTNDCQVSQGCSDRYELPILGVCSKLTKFQA